MIWTGLSWDALEIWETGADQTKQNLHTSFQRHTMHSSHYNSIDYYTSIYWGGHGNTIVILTLGLTQSGVLAWRPGKAAGSTCAGLSRQPWDDRHSFSSPEMCPHRQEAAAHEHSQDPSSPSVLPMSSQPRVIQADAVSSSCRKVKGPKPCLECFQGWTLEPAREGHVALVGWAEASPSATSCKQSDHWLEMWDHSILLHFHRSPRGKEGREEGWWGGGRRLT